MKPSTKEREAYQYFINKGYTPEVASAIVGNFMHESGLNTTIEGDKGYKGGSSFGLAQWRGERLSRLKSKYGDNWTDFKNQLEFTDWELKNTHKKAGEMLKKAKTIDEAGAIFSDYYEIPAKKYHQDANRRSKVNKVYASIGGMNIKTDFSNFEETKTSPTFVDVVHTQYGIDLPQVKEEKKDEVETAKEEIKQKTAEKTFLEDLKNNRLYEQPQEEEEQYIQPQEPQKSTLQSFAEIESFVDNPLFQEGGTWQSQQARVKAEKDAKLRELLKNKDFVNQLEAQAQQRRAQPPTERAVTQVDATKTARTNNPNKTSLTARNKTDKEIAEERQARIDAQAKANEQPFDWSNFRQSLADRSQATGDALRVSNEPNFFDDYLNPAAMIGSMADNLGQAPLRAQQEDSYMPYIASVGTPLAVGAMAGLGTQNTGQFVNNLANPLAGTGSVLNLMAKKAQNQVSLVKDLIFDKTTKLNRVTPFDSKNKIYNDIEQGYITLDNALEQKIKDLNTEEGRKRLIQQEKDYLQDFYQYDSAVDESFITKQAEQNANNRIEELEYMKAFGNKNKDFTYNVDRNAVDGVGITKPHIGTVQHRYGIPNNNAYYSYFDDVYNNPSGSAFIPGRLTLGRGYTDNVGTAFHEINHGLQRGRELKIDKELKQIVPDYKKNLSFDDIADYEYFKTGSRGQESSSFLAELRSQMQQDGFIKSTYDEITPEILKKAKDYYSKNKNKQVSITPTGLTGTSNTRLLNFARPIDENYKIISDAMNKLPTIAPIVGATYLTNQGEEQSPEFKEGGQIPISKDGVFASGDKPVIVPSPSIDMSGVNYRILGISQETGERKMMMPDQNYFFKNTANVLEIPLKNK